MLRMVRRCKYCGEVLPPPHMGRGKQKTFCKSSHRVMFAYRQRRPHKVTTGERRGVAPKLKLSIGQRMWFAALWDGEGHIGLNRRRKSEAKRWYYFPVAQVYNTHRGLIQQASDWLGASATPIEERAEGARTKRLFRLRVARRGMQRFLMLLRQHLVVKPRQAEIVAEFCKISDRCYVRSYPEEVYETMWREMKALNRRGL